MHERRPKSGSTPEVGSTAAATASTAEALAAAIIDSTDHAVVAEAFDGTVLSWNPGAEALYGYIAAEVVGGNISVLHPSGLAEDDLLAAALAMVSQGIRVEPFVTDCRRKDGTRVEVTITVSPVRDVNGQIVCASVLSQPVVAGTAVRDTLTGLPGPTLGEERLRATLRAQPRQTDLIAVLFVDVDDFKAVNGRFGHVAGDQILCSVAARIESVLRPGDVVFRHGGDEFVVVCLGIRDAGQALTVADRVARALRFSFQIDGGDNVSITASIAVATSPPDELPEGLIRKAAITRHRSKATGRGRVELLKPPALETIDLSDPVELSSRGAG